MGRAAKKAPLRGVRRRDIPEGTGRSPIPPDGISKPIPMGAAGLLSGELLLDLLKLFLLGLLGRVPAFGCHFLVDIVLHGQRIL